MSQESGLEEHRAAAPRSGIAVGILTVSDTRTPETDGSGDLIASLVEGAGHRVAVRAILPDDPERIGPWLDDRIDRVDVAAVLITGGTGISPRDQTYETLLNRLTKPLPGYGELFRMLSYAEIGAATILSRAVGGLMGPIVVLSMPGSKAAVRLAMEKIILPELGHLVREATKTGPPL
ncbi:MAG: MogA/MoaB family molybdenum cofactor biosynthesis protein [Isosphaeraceae bacterium]